MYNDVIVYLVEHAAGGCDGMDHTAKSFITKAYWTRAEADVFVKANSLYTIIPTIIENVEREAKSVINKLSPLEGLLVTTHLLAMSRGQAIRDAESGLDYAGSKSR